MTWAKGQSGNPDGHGGGIRPPRGETWAATIRDIGNMTVEDLKERIGEWVGLAATLDSLPPKAKLKELIVIRVYLSLINDPTPGLLTNLMERAEGRVPERIEANVTRTIVLDHNAAAMLPGWKPDELPTGTDVIDAEVTGT